MAKIKTLEKFEGEFNEVYQKFWVATSDNGNYFRTKELEYTDDGKPDIRETKWTHISNPTHLQITEQMHRKELIEYDITQKKPVNVDRGMSR